jgi:large subunit ribosomal protein L7/L12
MMELSKDQLIEAISSLSVIELSELVKALEEKFGVSSLVGSSLSPQPAVTASNASTTVPEKTEFNVILTSVGLNKISIIKSVREITGFGLKESKDLVDNVPKIVKENITKIEAEEIKGKLVSLGATVDIQ